MTPAHCAADNEIELLAALITARADINARDEVSVVSSI